MDKDLIDEFQQELESSNHRRSKVTRKIILGLVLGVALALALARFGCPAEETAPTIVKAPTPPPPPPEPTLSEPTGAVTELLEKETPPPTPEPMKTKPEPAPAPEPEPEPTPEPTVAPVVEEPQWRTVFITLDRREARDRAQALIRAGKKARVGEKEIKSRVYLIELGPYRDPSTARVDARRLSAAGYRDIGLVYAGEMLILTVGAWREFEGARAAMRDPALAMPHVGSKIRAGLSSQPGFKVEMIER